MGSLVAFVHISEVVLNVHMMPIQCSFRNCSIFFIFQGSTSEMFGEVIPCDENLCKLCEEAELNCVFAGCGHMVACIPCAEKVRNCPICREAITQRIRIFKAWSVPFCLPLVVNLIFIEVSLLSSRTAIYVLHSSCQCFIFVWHILIFFILVRSQWCTLFIAGK